MFRNSGRAQRTARKLDPQRGMPLFDQSQLHLAFHPLFFSFFSKTSLFLPLCLLLEGLINFFFNRIAFNLSFLDLADTSAGTYAINAVPPDFDQVLPGFTLNLMRVRGCKFRTGPGFTCQFSRGEFNQRFPTGTIYENMNSKRTTSTFTPAIDKSGLRWDLGNCSITRVRAGLGI